MMVNDHGLQEIRLPLITGSESSIKLSVSLDVLSQINVFSAYDGPWTNIFVSPDWATAEKLMLLIQGSGAVRYLFSSSFQLFVDLFNFSWKGWSVGAGVVYQ